MNGKVDWKVFAYKFRENPNMAMQDLSYQMFCRKYGLSEGQNAYYNQHFIETQPAVLDNGDVVGFQSKYLETPTVDSSWKAELIRAIKGAYNKYPGISVICFYLNRAFPQSGVQGESRTAAQIEIEKEANSLGISVEWVLPSNFDIILNQDDMRDLWEYYFRDPMTCKPELMAVKAQDTRSVSNEDGIRKLSNGLRINWKTRCLEQEAPGADNIIKSVELTKGQLRLLSVLVQGEGAVVNWKELYRRGVLMQTIVIDRAEKMRENDRRAGFDFSGMTAGKSNGEQAVFTRRRVFAPYYSEELSDEDAKEGAEKAVRDLCSVSDALAAIIEKAGNGRGYRILLQGDGSGLAGRPFSMHKRNWNEDSDWMEMEGDEKKNDNGYDEKWMRRYYSEVNGSFEGSITNAGSDGRFGEIVFGHYAMTDVYSNAYAMTDASGKTEAMLDYVERWYRGIDIGEDDSFSDFSSSPHANILIIHGQPGDGKTTFCKKAVYAHCYEGWLADAAGDMSCPRVLRISLNPNDSRDGIIENGTLQLQKAICVVDKKKDVSYVRNPRRLEEGALVILDGYDELSGKLLSVRGASTFSEFLEKAGEFAETYKCKVIITSRTMCIKDDLEKEVKDSQDIRAVSFAPLSHEQQDMMIERMIELDNRRNGLRHDLEDYKEIDLPTLRENRELNELLVIPTLFRMIVKTRFRPESKIQTEAELYGELFSNLMKHREKTKGEINGLLDEYGRFAVRIFNYNDDTCPFENEQIQENRELVYLFFTKGKTGQLGFLHPSFYQYFLARYIVNEIFKAAGLLAGRPEISVGTGGSEAETPEAGFTELFGNLRAGKITEPFVWKLMEQIAMVKARELPDSGRSNLMPRLQAFLDHMDSKHAFAEGIKDSNHYETEPNAIHDALTGAESAIFNLIGSLAAIEKGILGQAHSEEYKKAFSVHVEKDEEDTGEISGSRMQWAEIRKKNGIIYHGGNVNRARSRGISMVQQPFDYGIATDLLRRGNYSGLHIEGINLGSCNMSGARLNNAYMQGTCLENADFSDAHLSGAILKKSELKGAVFKGTDLSGADLSEAYTVSPPYGREEGTGKGGIPGKAASDAIADPDVAAKGAERDGVVPGAADFRGANLSGASLRKANLINAVFNGARLSGGANLAGANLSGACFEGADLSGADFTGADMSYAVLDGANLRGANLAGTDLSHASFNGADICGANFAGVIRAGEASFVRADLSGACMTGACFEGVHMERARLGGAMLKDAHLAGICLSDCDLENAVLAGADLSGSDLKRACLRNAYLVRTGIDREDSRTESDFKEADVNDADLFGADIEGALLTEKLYREIKDRGVVGSPVIVSEAGRPLQPPGMIRSAGRMLSGRLPGRRQSGIGRSNGQSFGQSGIISAATAADRIAFGRYSREKEGGEQPLYWRILKREEGRMLIITEELIDCRVYHGHWVGITWAECDLRRWLNEDFVYEAFTPEEWERIDKAQVDNPNNERFNTEGGDPTWDRVFVLSIKEAERYFRDDKDRMAAPTPYAIERGSYADFDIRLSNGERTGWWWLRSPGGYGDFAADVGRDGAVNEHGGGVVFSTVSVRPALWLNL